MVEIKFCGLTRGEDARAAVELGARYIGAVLAESPRQLSDAEAKEVLGAPPGGALRVAVLGSAGAEALVAARRAAADVVQLHGDPGSADIERLREHWDGQIWAVLRINGAGLPDAAADLASVADAIVLDSRVEGKLGGTGVTLAWQSLAPRLDVIRGHRARLVLAGGLTPDNVAEAISLIHPDIVDVSSGVESRVRVKDHARMRAFRDAVLGGAR